MTATQPSLFARSDTIFGACEGLGEDFGFNAQYLRVALGGLIFWNPLVALGAYATIALAVLASRKLFPNAVAPVAEATDAPVAAMATELRGENDAHPAPLAVAA